MKELHLLLAYKKKTKMTYKDMAYEMGVSLITLQRWFGGINSPSRMGMEKVKNYLKVFKRGDK